MTTRPATACLFWPLAWGLVLMVSCGDPGATVQNSPSSKSSSGETGQGASNQAAPTKGNAGAPGATDSYENSVPDHLQWSDPFPLTTNADGTPVKGEAPATQDEPSAHDSVPLAPDPKEVPELSEVVWNVFLPAAEGVPDPSLERLTPLTSFEGVEVEFYQDANASGGLRLQGHRTLGANGAKKQLHGPEWRWYANGQLQLRRSYRNGKASGPHEEWHENGFKKSEGHFVEDQLHGHWVRWHAMGGLWKVQDWLEGLPHGKQWVFFDSGAVSQLVEWDHGKKHGADHNWNKRGFPIEDAQWREGKRHGHHLQWHGREKRATEKHYDQGKATGPWLEWWPDGKKHLTGQMKDGNREGEWLVWNEAGVLITRETYASGEFDGPREAWSNEGIRVFEGSFESGKPVGVQTVFYEGGGPKERRTFSSPATLGGPMTTWHPNGKKASDGQMLDNKRQGKWSIWDESGELLKAWSGTYEAGVRVGD